MKKLSKDNFSALLSSDKARTFFVFIGLAAVLLIFLSSQLGINTDSKENVDVDFSADAYCEELNVKLTEIFEDIEGVGKVQILLTLDSSYEYVYLNDNKTLTKVLEPKIRGVAVACTGGDDAVVIEKVTKVLTTVLSVSTSNISVSKLV